MHAAGDLAARRHYRVGARRDGDDGALDEQAGEPERLGPVADVARGVRQPGRARPVEPWVVGAGVAGTVLAGATGLLVWGQAQTELRGGQFKLGTAHFWLGIVVTVIVFVVAGWRLWRVQQDRHTHGRALLAGGVLALVAVLAQGYLGGRMTYDQGVGVYRAGQFAQSASGARKLDAALAKGASPATAGRVAFARSGLGCASCHGDQAQGLRGPSLAGGAELEEFRGVHGAGLFPPDVVTDRDFAAVNAWLRTLGRRAQ